MVEFDKVMEALEVAAVFHRKQTRRDEANTPYIVHPIRVTATLYRVGVRHSSGIPLLCAAALHDVIEDCSGAHCERVEENRALIYEQFGPKTLEIVDEVSDNRLLTRDERRAAQLIAIPLRCPDAKLLTLADKFDNLYTMLRSPPMWDNERSISFILHVEKVLHLLHGVNFQLEDEFKEALIRVKRQYGLTPQHVA